MANGMDRKRGLGRGLSALMADVTETENASKDSQSGADRMIPIEQIQPNPDQPRRQFIKDDLDELAGSIREKGVIQPLIVRRKGDSLYEIVAGERRWRAAQIAQLHELPVVIRDFTDVEVLEVAIIENIQRADLNPVEEASGYKQLMDRFGHTQEKMSEALGKSRSHIANLLRLLNLPEAVLTMVRQGDISAGHARALILADDPLGLAQQIIKKGLSVRATEDLVRKSKNAAQETNRDHFGADDTVADKDADTKALERDLSAALGMKVTLRHKPGDENGQLTLHYRSLEQLDDLCRTLGGS